MERYNWTEIFSEIPDHFHKTVADALLRLPEEKEKCDMKKMQKRLSFKKAILIAAAAVFVLGATALAAGKIFTISSHSYGVTYREMPDESEIQKVLEVKAKTVQQFENGLKFTNGRIADTQAKDANGEVILNYNTLSFAYKKAEKPWACI